MVEKIKCKSDDCEGYIAPSTAEKTGGYCMVCVRDKERKERQQYIKENRRDINLFEGVTDPVEIIKLHHVKRKYDPLIRQIPYHTPLEDVYRILPQSDVDRLIDFIIQEAEKGNLNQYEVLILELALFTTNIKERLQMYFASKKIYYPFELYNNASDETVEIMIKNAKGGTERIDDFLISLAWTNSDEVVHIFEDLAKNPPEWSKNRNRPLHEYSKFAGWELDAFYKKRLLYFDTCFQLVPQTKHRNDDSVQSLFAIDQSCQFCDSKLTAMIELDLDDPRFAFLGLQGDSIRIATCEICCYTDTYYHGTDTNSATHWSECNKKPEHLPLDEYQDHQYYHYTHKNYLSISSSQRAPEYAANYYLPTKFSQLGGMPTWIQYEAYPTCPSCKKTMIFVAQISYEDIEERSEGITYLFLFTDCMISASTYQQT